MRRPQFTRPAPFPFLRKKGITVALRLNFVDGEGFDLISMKPYGFVKQNMAFTVATSNENQFSVDMHTHRDVDRMIMSCE